MLFEAEEAQRLLIRGEIPKIHSNNKSAFAGLIEQRTVMKIFPPFFLRLLRAASPQLQHVFIQGNGLVIHMKYLRAVRWGGMLPLDNHVHFLE